MKIETLEAKISQRAAQETQEAIRQFLFSVREAAFKLLMIENARAYAVDLLGGPELQDAADELIRLASGRGVEGWPKKLWVMREERLKETILSQMDSLQRLLLTKDEELEFHPEESEEP